MVELIVDRLWCQLYKRVALVVEEKICLLACTETVQLSDYFRKRTTVDLLKQALELTPTLISQLNLKIKMFLRKKLTGTPVEL